MNSYELETAFYLRLTALEYVGVHTLRPDEVFDPGAAANALIIRRGTMLAPNVETVAFGHGVYSRIEGIYQIDLWAPRDGDGAFKTLKTLSDEHLLHFFPANGRGLTITEQSTSAHIVRRPSQRHMGREGAYLRELVEVDFYVEAYPTS